MKFVGFHRPRVVAGSLFLVEVRPGIFFKIFVNEKRLVQEGSVDDTLNGEESVLAKVISFNVTLDGKRHSNCY